MKTWLGELLGRQSGMVLSNFYAQDFTISEEGKSVAVTSINSLSSR